MSVAQNNEDFDGVSQGDRFFPGKPFVSMMWDIITKKFGGYRAFVNGECELPDSTLRHLILVASMTDSEQVFIAALEAALFAHRAPIIRASRS